MLRAALAEACIVVAIEHDRHASDLEDLASLLGDTRVHRSEVVTAMRTRASRLRGSGMADVLASIELPEQGASPTYAPGSLETSIETPFPGAGADHSPAT